MISKEEREAIIYAQGLMIPKMIYYKKRIGEFKGKDGPMRDHVQGQFDRMMQASDTLDQLLLRSWNENRTKPEEVTA